MSLSILISSRDDSNVGRDVSSAAGDFGHGFVIGSRNASDDVAKDALGKNEQTEDALPSPFATLATLLPRDCAKQHGT